MASDDSIRSLKAFADGLQDIFKEEGDNEKEDVPPPPEHKAKKTARAPKKTPSKTSAKRAKSKDIGDDQQGIGKIINLLRKVKIGKGMVKVTTPIDAFLKSVRDRPGLRDDQLVGEFGMDVDALERWSHILSSKDLLRIQYAVNPLDRPLLFPLDEVLEAKDILHFNLDNSLITSSKDKSLLKEYTLSVDEIPVAIRIWNVPEDFSRVYEIEYPRIGAGTFAAMDFMRARLAERVQISGEDLMDKERLLHLKDRFVFESYTIVDEIFPNLSERMKKILSMLLVHHSHGLGILEVFLSDPNLEEVVINTSRFPLSIYHRKYNWMRTNVVLTDESIVFNYASQMGRRAGRQVTSLDPLMDARLPTGERVNATLSPVSTVGHTITLRKQSKKAFTMMHMIDPRAKTMSLDMAAMLWTCVENEMNIMVVGGTASGKTSVLNALCSLLPLNQHVVTIEDTRELSLPQFMDWNWIPMSTRPPTPEGKGEVTMLDLMVNSLRMRPDRIILGEVRRAREAQVMFEAMHTGHAAYSTFHANLAEYAFRRLVGPPISIPEVELSALHLFLVQGRNRRYGFRRTLELVEVLPTRAGVTLRRLFRWNAGSDTFEAASKSQRIFSDVSAMTGATEKEILQELGSKVSILKWMQRQNVKEIDDVGRIVNTYYNETRDGESRLIEMAAQDKSPEYILSEVDDAEGQE